MKRDLLSYVHDLAEAAVMVGILVAVVVYWRRGHHPVDLFADMQGSGFGPRSAVM